MATADDEIHEDFILSDYLDKKKVVEPDKPIMRFQNMIVATKENFIIEKNSDIAQDYALDTTKPLGKGAYGIVYKAQDRETGELRAIKQISKRTTKLKDDVL